MIKKLTKTLIFSVVVVFLAGISFLLVRTGITEMDKRLPVPDDRLQQALDGVVRNDDWQPIVRRIKGLDMVLVPAGCYRMGSTEQQVVFAEDSCDSFYGIHDCLYDFKATEQPAHTVCFEKPFWIAQNETTHRQFGSRPSRNMNTSNTSRSWPAESMNIEQASVFCEERGLRLPTEAEWEYAARGPDGLIFPWGDEFNPLLLVWHTLYPDRVGSIPEGASWVGANDLSGGVLEWVLDWFSPYPGELKLEPVGPASGGQRIARGGSWFSYATFFVRAAHRELFDSGYTSSVIGFRCAGDFE